MDKKGSVLVLSLLIVVVLLLFGGVFLGLTISNYNMIYVESLYESSFWIARAGLSQAIHDTRLYIFDKDTFSSLKQKWISWVKLGNGKYRIGIIPVKGLGTREIIIVCEGYNIESRQSIGLMTRMQISCPADYLYFFNGNGIIAKYWLRASIYGPIHANGSLYLDTGAGGTSQTWLRIMKSDSEDFRGPTVSATGIIFRGKPSDVWGGYDPSVYINPEAPLIIGIGNIEQAMQGGDTTTNYSRGFTYGTGKNNLDSNRFYITRLKWKGGDGPDPTESIPSYPGGNSPDETFPVTKEDGTIEPLLLDGKHGAYNIKIPSQDKIFKEFEPYIDKNFKIDYNNLLGGKIVEFYNDVLLKKVLLEKTGDRTYKFENKGNEVIGQVRYDNMWSASTYPPLGSITHCESPVFSPTLNYYHVNYLLFQDRGISNITVGGISKNLGTDYLFYPVMYPIPNNIVFTQASGIGAGSIGVEVKSDKLKYVYGTKDKNKYTYEFGISPLTYTISGDTIVFKSQVTNSDPVISYMNGEYNWEKRNELLQYKTASFLINPEVTTISRYEYTYNATGGNYGNHSRIMKSNISDINFSTKYDEVITTELIISGYTLDRDKGRISYYNSTNPVVVKGKPLLKYDNRKYWIGLPLVWLLVTTSFTPASTISIDMVDASIPTPQTITGTGVIVAIVDSDGKFVTPTGHSAGDYKLTYSTDYIISGSDTKYASPGYVELSQVMQDFVTANSGTVLISYGSRYREITGITGTVESPESYGVYPCIDQYIKAVSIDLSQINENNYPKEGIIYSDVPLIVFGIPKKKITVVCKEDVYVSSINYSYRDNSGNWVSSSLVDNDVNAEPVAIISTKGIFAYYGANTGGRTYITESKDAVITLNKVVLYTPSDKIFSFGTSWTLVKQNGSILHSWMEGVNSIRFFTGSQILGNSLGVTDKDIYNSIYYIEDAHMDFNYGGGISKSRYPESFRENLSPHIPLDIKVLDYRPIREVDKINNFMETLKINLEKGELTNKIYGQLLNALFQ